MPRCAYCGLIPVYTGEHAEDCPKDPTKLNEEIERDEYELDLELNWGNS